MSVRDYEHKLKIEIGENEHRKEFTFSERMAWARELERVESAKARERQGARTDIQENFPECKVQTRDIVAEKIGIGSGKQYEKAKFITENADSSTIAKLDNEEISIHKAYTELQARLKEKDKLLHQETERRKRAEQEAFAVRKSEQLTRKQLEEFEQQEPQIIEKEVVKEVAIESLEHINLINELNNNNKKAQGRNPILSRKKRKQCRRMWKIYNKNKTLWILWQIGLSTLYEQSSKNSLNRVLSAVCKRVPLSMQHLLRKSICVGTFSLYVR
ncbi:hypothetical protein ACT7C1_26245 [Bacillus paranthracis]